MKDIFTYLAMVALAIQFVACSPSPENNEENVNRDSIPNPTGAISTVDTIDVPCLSGSTVQIVCDSVVISLPCNDGSKVPCGDKMYVAAPVDTIDSPRSRLTQKIYHRSLLPTGILRSKTGEPVDTIDINITCWEGSTVMIVCDSKVIPLPCNEGSEATCGDYNYVAAPVDTIDSR